MEEEEERRRVERWEGEESTREEEEKKKKGRGEAVSRGRQVDKRTRGAGMAAAVVEREEIIPVF
jgi:hypothetical protein